jgi:ERCC4-type nuclease
MTDFQNIFTKKEIEIKQNQKPRIKIFIDYREKNCFIPILLKKLNFEIEFRELKVGDYLVNDVIIERKSVEDFLQSMKSQRLVNQLNNLQGYEDKILLIEGIEEQELYNDENQKGINANSIRGFLISILLKYRVPILFTKNQKDTAKFISVLAKRKQKESRLNVKKKSLNKKEQIQFILEGFPGIGPNTAKKLLQQFKTIKNIINSSQEELTKIIGKKAEIFGLTNINCDQNKKEF